MDQFYLISLKEEEETWMIKEKVMIDNCQFYQKKLVLTLIL